MYLTNDELKKIHDKVIIGGDNEEYPFEPDKQIKVCSIDIRIDKIFWRIKQLLYPVSLTHSKIFDISPRRWWKRIALKEQGSIKVKPGELILGRSYEKISIPDDLVGRIMTRSSYARLGISTDCTCDLLNPGWEGHVPLEIRNNGPNTIVINPYLPMCQIMLMPLAGKVDSSYKSAKYKSKYLHDDGGPSFWWRDNLVEKVYSGFNGQNVSDDIIEALMEKFASIDDQALYRLEKIVANQMFTNANDLLEEFHKHEKKRSFWYQRRRSFFKWAFPALIVTSLASLRSEPYGFWHYFTWILALISFPFFLYYVITDEVKFYPDL